MTEHKKDDDAALFLFLVGILIALAIIILPFVWSFAREELAKSRVSVVISEECKAGASCQICTDSNTNRTCVAGICDAQGNCLAPMQKNATLKYPERGLRALVK